jgi:hypothetical protein
MKLKSIMLLLTVTGGMASLYMRRRTLPGAMQAEGDPRAGPMDIASGLPQREDESLNAGERVQELAPGIGARPARPEDEGEWFGSSSQESETPAGTGLTDLTRGA